MSILAMDAIFPTIGIWLVAVIYKVAAYAFKIFLILANGELINSSEYELLFTNCYVILGVVMLFIIAFSLLRSIINPDDQKQGTAAIKKMIINLVTSGIMLAILPTIFGFAFDFQASILGEQNVLGRFFGFGSTASDTGSNATNQVTEGANLIANSVFTAFFNVNTDNCEIVDNSSLQDCQVSITGANGESLAMVMRDVSSKGNFGAYSAFAENVAAEEIEFGFLLSLIGGLLLIFIGVSYCFDMGVRLVKLVFYQMIAPIPIMFRVIPEGKLSGAFNQWLKTTVACYLEVFIRIFVLYFCVYLCIKISESPFFALGTNWNYGFFTWLYTKAFVYLGVVTFMKQAPKLISDITGIDSGKMGLGLKEKMLPAMFATGAMLGGGATALTRNAVNAYGNVKKNWGGASGLERAKMIASGFASTFAGGASGMARSAKSGWKAKNISDMKGAASKGATSAVNARDKRAAYKASHGGTLGGAMSGHIQDVWTGVQTWAGAGMGDTNLSYYATAAQATDSFNSLSESTYKEKQEYMDQNSKVKALKAQLDTVTDPTQRAAIQASYDREKAALDKMQKSMAAKKKDVISIAATKLAVDQKVNYSNSEEFQEAYRKAIHEGFGAKEFKQFSNSEIVQRVVQENGEDVTKNFRQITYVNNNNESKTFEMDETTARIFDAMLSGQEVSETWINEGNVMKIQEAIDQANIERQHIKAVNERKHIMSTGNRSIEKKDK